MTSKFRDKRLWLQREIEIRATASEEQKSIKLLFCNLNCAQKTLNSSRHKTLPDGRMDGRCEEELMCDHIFSILHLACLLVRGLALASIIPLSNSLNPPPLPLPPMWTIGRSRSSVHVFVPSMFPPASQQSPHKTCYGNGKIENMALPGKA